MKCGKCKCGIPDVPSDSARMEYATDAYDDDTTAIKCPACGGHCTHHGAIECFVRDSEDSGTGLHVIVDGEIPLYVDNLMAGNPSFRRDGLRISLTCELCCAESEIEITQHKGSTYLSVGVVRIPRNQEELF